MDIQDYYADPKNCTKEILLARKVMTSTQSTVSEWDGVERALGFMYLYCPDDMRQRVYATLHELNRRRISLELDGRFPEEVVDD